MTENGKTDFHVLLPTPLVKAYDEAIKAPFNGNRTAAIMALMRAFIKQRTAKKAAAEVVLYES